MKLKVNNLTFLFKTLWQALGKSNKKKKVLASPWKQYDMVGIQNHASPFYYFKFADL